MRVYVGIEELERKRQLTHGRLAEYISTCRDLKQDECEPCSVVLARLRRMIVAEWRRQLQKQT